MKDERSIFAKCFSLRRGKKFEYGASFVFFMMGFIFCYNFKLPIILNSQQYMTSGLKMMKSFDKTVEPQQKYSRVEMVESIHNLSNSRSDIYEMNGDIRIHNKSTTIFLLSSRLRDMNMSSSWIVRPYARKFDNMKVGVVREWKIQTLGEEELPVCRHNFSVPAILFSTGSFSGNHFHAFSDILIPLYLTTRQFNGTVVFLTTNSRSWWKSRYNKIFQKLSKYDVIDMDNENEVLCFSKLIVGLKANREFGSDPLASPYYSMLDFRNFLRNTYSLHRESVGDFNITKRKPRLLIISRKRSRRITNEFEVARMAQNMGIEVVVKEMESNITSVARLVNSFDVIMGVHGAGLTNMLFLPENAVVIQIVPFALEMPSNNFFGLPSKDMKLKYLEYRVNLNESSLLGKYPPDSEVYTNPHAIHMKGFQIFHSIYLVNQEVHVDLERFRGTLLNALKLLGGKAL